MRQIGRDLRLRHALEAVVDLVLEQVGRLRQQVDPHQPPRQVADHLVALAPAGVSSRKS